MPLTDKQILALRPTEGSVTKASDGGGLQLWVTPSGGRLWNFAYQFVGKQRKLAIGPYPTVSLKDARGRRDEAKRQLSAGLDPSQQKRIAKIAKVNEQANTFDVVANEFVAKKRDEGKAEATVSKAEMASQHREPIARPATDRRNHRAGNTEGISKASRRASVARAPSACVRRSARLPLRNGDRPRPADPTLALRGALEIPDRPSPRRDHRPGRAWRAPARHRRPQRNARSPFRTAIACAHLRPAGRVARRELGGARFRQSGLDDPARANEDAPAAPDTAHSPRPSTS